MQLRGLQNCKVVGLTNAIGLGCSRKYVKEYLGLNCFLSTCANDLLNFVQFWKICKFWTNFGDFVAVLTIEVFSGNF